MEKSRNELILESIVSGEYNFSSPQSRNEALLIALGEKLKDIDTPSEDVIRQAVTDWLNENPVEVVSGGDPLAGKKILFVGDSICYGVGLGSGQHPYPYWVGQLHPTATIVNDSVGGQTMSYQDPSIGQSLGQKCMDDRYSGSEYADADIIVVEGGPNDMMRNKPFGTLKTLSENIYQKYYKDEIQTYAGALEYIFKYFNQHFYGKRILFTTIHRLADTSGADKQWAYWECASEACAKWNVEFIDLFHSIPTELTGSQLHPNNETHRDWYARIIDDVLCGRRSFPVSKDKTYYGKFIVGMSALIQKPNYTTNEFKVGDTFSQANWRINSVGYNGAQGANVTSKVTWDLSDIPMTSAKVLTTEGTFFAHGWANLDGVFCACAVPVYVSQGDEPVPPEPEAELTGIGASKTKTEYSVGETLNTDDIVVTGTYTDGSQRNLTSIATIDKSGVNMNAEGNYVINVSVEGGFNATINITVSAVVPPEDITKDGTVLKDLGYGGGAYKASSGQQISYIYVTQDMANGNPTMTMSVAYSAGRWFAWHLSNDVPAAGVSCSELTPDWRASDPFTDKPVDLTPYIGKYIGLRTAMTNDGTFSIKYSL